MNDATAMQRIAGPDGRMEDVWALPIEESFLATLFTDLFDNHYERISWGPLIPGASYELKAPRKPVKIAVSNGYMTVHWGDKGHFHLCIGDIAVPEGRPDAVRLAAERRPARAEFFRSLDRDGFPHSWGLRLFNGRDESLIAIFFPNPYVTDHDEITARPDWERIALWEDFLPRYAGAAPDGLDRQGRGFARY